MRIIIHVDLDSFYASCEELRHPELMGKPVVVCMFSARGNDSGAVATANYKAREMGIKSGMPISFARKRASIETAFLKADIQHYRSISQRIMLILESKADKFQQVSVDEAYLDVSSLSGMEKAVDLAKEIKEEILSSEKLTCSIGIGPNKLVSKMATSFRKPDGLTPVGNPKEFLFPMPVKKLHGIGPKTAEMLNEAGVTTIGDLASFDAGKLSGIVGKNRAVLLHQKANGIDDSPVEEKDIKQISRLTTLTDNSSDASFIMESLQTLAEDIHHKLEKRRLLCRTISVMIIDSSIQMHTKSMTTEATDSLDAIRTYASRLLAGLLSEKNVVARRAGIRVSNFEARKDQKSLSDPLFRR